MANYEVLSHAAIVYLTGLIRDLASVSEGVDDLHLASNSTFSSVKIDTLIRQCLQDSNEYTDRLVANLSRLELKIATSESEITQPNTMYLYKPSGSTSYEQYVVIEGTKVLLGTTDINMGDYYTITQADAKFVLKTDFDSLKTTVDKKIDKTDIVDNLTSTDTDKPLSANQGKVLKDEVDLKANDSDVVKKTDIVTSISSTSTDSQVPSAKAVYDNAIKNNNIKTYASLEQLGLTAGTETLQSIANSMVDGSIAIILNVAGANKTIYPTDYGNLIAYRGNNNRIDFMYYPTTDHVEAGKGLLYICSYHATKDILLEWQRVCTTSAPNSKKKITLDSSIFSEGDVYYEVKNGVCYVSILNLKPVKAGTSLLVSNSMPKTNYYILQTLSLGNTDTLPTTPICARIGAGDTKLYIHSNNNTKALYGSFSYPVAE